MKSKNLPLAGWLIIGILGAPGATAAAAIHNSISGAQIAAIARSIEPNDIQLKYIQRNSSDIGAADNAINKAIAQHAIPNISDAAIQAAALDAQISHIAA